MKSFSTFAIAVTLFVLCLIEKESKIRAMEFNKNNKQVADSLNINNPMVVAPFYASLNEKGSALTIEKLQLSALTNTDSTSKTLAPTPFLGKLPLLNTLSF